MLSFVRAEDGTHGRDPDRLPPATYDRDRASELVKRLVGEVTSSHGGTYVDRRKGLLDEIPHMRRIRGVVIVRTEDAGGSWCSSRAGGGGTRVGGK